MFFPLLNQIILSFNVRFEMIVELKKGTMPGLANRLSLFKQVSKHLIRYIDWPKFEHCLGAKLVHGPKLITKKCMVKSY